MGEGAPALALEDVSVAFRSAGNERYVAVQGATLRVKAGEFVSVVGPTGCGLSLIHI